MCTLFCFGFLLVSVKLSLPRKTKSCSCSELCFCIELLLKGQVSRLGRKKALADEAR